MLKFLSIIVSYFCFTNITSNLKGREIDQNYIARVLCKICRCGHPEQFVGYLSVSSELYEIK